MNEYERCSILLTCISPESSPLLEKVRICTYTFSADYRQTQTKEIGLSLLLTNHEGVLLSEFLAIHYT